MNDSTRNAPGSPLAQRDALAESERMATETEPANFRDKANADKVVEIPEVGPGEQPIRGLDPK